MEYKIVWWNVENLFDIENSSHRPEWLQKRLKKSLTGWNTRVLNKKINQLVKVISAINTGKGPDILGVCEIESEAVLDKLVGALKGLQRDYGVIHADTKDRRGIDVAFIYDKKLFKVNKKNIFNQVILKRNATRDILQATFETKKSYNEFILMGHHWPSRLGGEEASAPYRMMAGETMAYWHERIIDKKGEIPVFSVGDFNDEPFNVSLEKYGLSTRSLSKVKSKRSTKPYFYNLMWNIMDDTIGTHSYNGVWGFLDQALVNRAGLDRSGVYCTPKAVEIFTMEGMIKSGKPVRFSRPAAKGGCNDKGFSDHLPIVITIKEIT